MTDIYLIFVKDLLKAPHQRLNPWSRTYFLEMETYLSMVAKLWVWGQCGLQSELQHNHGRAEKRPSQYAHPPDNNWLRCSRSTFKGVQSCCCSSRWSQHSLQVPIACNFSSAGWGVLLRPSVSCEHQHKTCTLTKILTQAKANLGALYFCGPKIFLLLKRNVH